MSHCYSGPAGVILTPSEVRVIVWRLKNGDPYAVASDLLEKLENYLATTDSTKPNT